MYKEILFTKDNNIATITMNRPDKFNTITVLLGQELEDAVKRVRRDDEIKVVILTGAGERAFCGGADLGAFDSMTKKGMAPSRYDLTAPGAYWALALGELEKPTIAAINGVAAGGGMGLTAMCDIRIAVPETRFVPAFAERGLTPDNGLTYTLPRIVGLSKALEIMLTGRTVDAAEAERIGLVNKVVPRERLMEEAVEMATRIANLAPVAVELTKLSLHRSTSNDLRSQFYFEAFATAKCFNTEDMDEGVASFLEKRKPQFKGR